MSDLPEVLREYKVRIIPTDEAGPQPDYPNNFGLRTNFGDCPDHIQPEEEYEQTCTSCAVFLECD